MHAEPKEGYVAVRRDPKTKEKFTENRYVFINKASADDELWLVCVHGIRAGEALRFAEINEAEWIIEELEGWADEVDAYYVDNVGPMELYLISDEIADMVRMSPNDKIEPTIRMERMSREAYMRVKMIWNSVYDRLRESPEAFKERFLEKEAAGFVTKATCDC